MEIVKDYITQAKFVRFDDLGAIQMAGHQGVAFTTDALARGERIILSSIEFDPLTVARTHYVEVPRRRLLEKSECPATLDGMTLRKLPVPCRIEISSPAEAPTVYDWSDTALTLSFEHPGQYTVRVISVPYLPGVFEMAFDG